MASSVDVVLKRFDAPDETRVFEKGRFEIVRVGGMTIGRATFEPYVSLQFTCADGYASRKE